MPEFVAPSLPASLERKLKACKSLPSLPAVALKIVQLARMPSAGSSQLAKLVSKDASLSAKILSAANSSFYGSASEFTSIQQAINRLGMEAALALSLSFSLTNTAKQRKNGMSLDMFWRRSVISAVFVRQIKQQLNFKFDADTVFLCAVLQDIGMLALNEIDPQTYGVVFHSAKSHKQLISFEEKEYGTCHRQVGFWLAKHWQLPEKYCQLIFASHKAAAEIAPNNYEQRILALSGLLADPWVSAEKEAAMSVAYQAAQDYLHLSEQELNHLLIQMQDCLPQITQLFELSSPEELDTFTLLQEAKQLLVERNLRMMQQLEQQQEELKQLRAATKLLREQNKRDPLTKVYNRQHLEKEIEQSFNSIHKLPGRLAIVFIDLDYFKTLNDNYGHAIGDQALIAFAQILEQELDVKCLCGRYGGEEFVVLMPGYGQDEAYKFAKRLQQRLADTPLLKHKGKDIYISASMGLAISNTAPENPQGLEFSQAKELVAAADQAMYNAKRTGRNRILLYTPQGAKDLSAEA